MNLAVSTALAFVAGATVVHLANNGAPQATVRPAVVAVADAAPGTSKRPTEPAWKNCLVRTSGTAARAYAAMKRLGNLYEAGRTDVFSPCLELEEGVVALIRTDDTPYRKHVTARTLMLLEMSLETMSSLGSPANGPQ